jgi:hypothetical protein
LPPPNVHGFFLPCLLAGKSGLAEVVLQTIFITSPLASDNQLARCRSSHPNLTKDGPKYHRYWCSIQC